MCTAPTQCWAHGAAAILALVGLSRRSNCIQAVCLHWLGPCSQHALPGSTCPLFERALALPMRRPHAACTLHARCLCAACTLPVRCHARCLGAVMRTAFVCCLYIRLWATCTSLSPCPMFPLHVFAWSCPQGLGGMRPWHGHGPPFSLRTWLKEHYRPFSEFLEETSKWLRRYNRIFT